MFANIFLEEVWAIANSFFPFRAIVRQTLFPCAKWNVLKLNEWFPFFLVIFLNLCSCQSLSHSVILTHLSKVHVIFHSKIIRNFFVLSSEQIGSSVIILCFSIGFSMFKINKDRICLTKITDYQSYILLHNSKPHAYDPFIDPINFLLIWVFYLLDNKIFYWYSNYKTERKI